MQGFVLINKPEGWTSHDVVHRIRRTIGIQTVGHAGTLDPFATGLLLVGIGRKATRMMSQLIGLDKTYRAQFILGAESNTDDRTGVVIPKPLPSSLTKEHVAETLKTFVGTIEQMPPQFSAIKIQGKKMYEAARAGITLKAAPRTITIFKIEILAMWTSEKTIEIDLIIQCSSGTYIRALARDLGEKLETGGYVQSLERTQIGPFCLSDSKTIHPIELQGSQLAEVLLTKIVSTDKLFV